MADFCCTPVELEDLHRLLPREILADIGVADAIDHDTAAQCGRGGAVDVEELAAHLASVLGLATRRHQRQLPPSTRATAAQHGCGRTNGAGANGGNGGTAYHAPALGGKNGFLLFDFEAMQQTQRFVPAALCAGPVYHPLPPRRHGRAGTGVFLPRAEAYQTRASRQTRPPKKEAPNATTMLKLQRQ